VARKDDIPDVIRKRIDRCKEEIAVLGIVLKGSVTRRYMPCGKPGCKCMADTPVLHGPYFQWTSKVDGTTRTVRLTRDQAVVYQQWAANARRLKRILARWEAAGEAAAMKIQKISSR
jgi:hypothetical protein